MTDTPTPDDLSARLAALALDLSQPSSATVNPASMEQLRRAVAKSRQFKTHLPVTSRGTSPVCPDTGMVAFSVQMLTGHVLRLSMCAEDFDWIVQGIEGYRPPRPAEDLDDIPKQVEEALANSKPLANSALGRAVGRRRPFRGLWIGLNALLAMNRKAKERVTDRLGRLNS
ncbi:hypothetical protein [Roseibium sediminicola]|uniref:Uncharacterized protein n=1 Tax=Roseibium sediminicola TaxID=2933272 RepID=A0ABT0H0K2_9HYPH|nr:hypothetical protein [Roseibium sp. CAU 1639]MCK7615218.1 hypothetical protein [Roseibium sp. CAU 1639]